jgi:hypothetical protein
VQLPQWVAFVSVLTQTPLQFVSVDAHAAPPSPGVASVPVSPGGFVSLAFWSALVESPLASSLLAVSGFASFVAASLPVSAPTDRSLPASAVGLKMSFVSSPPHPATNAASAKDIVTAARPATQRRFMRDPRAQ